MRGVLFLSITSLLLLGGTAKETSISIRNSNLAFAWNWFDYLSKNEGNILFSPISGHSILTAVYQGAEGATKKLIAEKLKLPEKEAAAQGYKELFDLLDHSDDIVQVANKIYVQSGHELKEDIKATLDESFSTEIDSIDFSKNEEAAVVINSWVANKTNDKIKNLISASDLNEDTRLALLNAVHLKGKWKKEFSEIGTEDKPFYLDDNTTITVPTMYQESVFKYKVDRDRGFKVIELPFTNEEYILFIVLPIDRSGLPELVDNLLSAKDENILYDGLEDQYVKVMLPKFKFSKDANLQEVLKDHFDLGELFDPSSCDLSGMLEDGKPLHVSKTVQKVFIDVTESGCEATAATVAIEESRMLEEPNTLEEFKEFKADHPFLFEIRYKNDVHIPLFCGRMSNPAEK